MKPGAVCIVPFSDFCMNIFRKIEAIDIYRIPFGHYELLVINLFSVMLIFEGGSGAKGHRPSRSERHAVQRFEWWPKEEALCWNGTRRRSEGIELSKGIHSVDIY